MIYFICINFVCVFFPSFNMNCDNGFTLIIVYLIFSKKLSNLFSSSSYLVTDKRDIYQGYDNRRHPDGYFQRPEEPFEYNTPHSNPETDYYVDQDYHNNDNLDREMDDDWPRHAPETSGSNSNQNLDYSQEYQTTFASQPGNQPNWRG